VDIMKIKLSDIDRNNISFTNSQNEIHGNKLVKCNLHHGHDDLMVPPALKFSHFM
jgi:hypothetical protein